MLRKLSKRQFFNTDKEKSIELAREKLKKDDIVKDLFKEYNVPLEKIDDISIEFDDDLDVSAKTVNKKIYLNTKILEKGQKSVEHYLIHEITHFCQQLTGNIKGNSATVDYLDRENEIESFQNQVEYRREHEGEGTAEEYVDSLTDYHGLRGEEKIEKENELLDEK